MSTESPNRDEDKFSPAVDAEELTTLEEVFDGLEIPAPAPVLGEDGSVVASGFAPGSASGYDAGSTAASGAEAGPTARSAPGSDAGPAREPVVEPVAGPASGPAPGSAAGPVAPKPTSGPATKPTPRAARAASRAVPGTASGPAREPGPSTRRPSSTAASSGPARTAGAAARTPAASRSAPEASTPPEAEAYPAFPSSTPRAGRHARTDGRSAASAASAVSSASAASSTSAASSDDAADLSEAPGRSGQTTAVRRRSLFARTSADDAGAPRPTDQALPADRPGPARAAAASAPSAPDTARTPPGTARARSEAAAPESAEPAQERAGKPDGETTGTPAKEAETPAWLTREAARAQRRSSRRSRQRSDDDILLDGSTIVGRPASRAGAHWAGVLMSLVLLPAAWFFVHGAADVLTSTVEPHRFAFNPKAIFELVAGLLTMGVALWTACRSSLGSIVVGTLSAVLGLLFLLLPTPMNGLVGPVLDRLTAQSTLGADLAAYFWTDAYSGKFVVLGLFMVMVGVVSHSARRAGRREQEIIDRGRRF
ncbi:hypothetical protein [Actinomyces dentalis]|uniref:hypothetical protein n=1 Tax=Actinomyces dentalis TaxID=272548 RepID=UPI0028EE6775|nr:hypothetical protein [Actinomyces dentalis]